MSENVRLVRHSQFGFRHLDPLPSGEATDDYYRDAYSANIKAGGRADEMRRLLRGDKETQRQRRWLEKTFFRDVVSVLKRHAPGTRVFDVGCGTGDLLHYLSGRGFQSFGIEPSRELQQAAVAQRLLVEDLTMDEYMRARDQHVLFDTVLLLNVLEHVPDPVALVAQCAEILTPGGIFFVRVPNDFSELQLAAQEKLKVKPWWVTVPDHVNYFDVTSLTSLLHGTGFEVVDTLTDFPMELFLLLGEDYTSDPAVGRSCHERRMAFELALPFEVRQRLYRSFAENGIGRTCMLVGRKVSG